MLNITLPDKVYPRTGFGSPFTRMVPTPGHRGPIILSIESGRRSGTPTGPYSVLKDRRLMAGKSANHARMYSSRCPAMSWSGVAGTSRDRPETAWKSVSQPGRVKSPLSASTGNS